MKLLVCDISGEMHGMVQKPDAILVNSPVQCLNQAIIERPDAVLGGHRLHEICETQGHLQCEYYLNPRRRS